MGRFWLEGGRWGVFHFHAFFDVRQEFCHSNASSKFKFCCPIMIWCLSIKVLFEWVSWFMLGLYFIFIFSLLYLFSMCNGHDAVKHNFFGIDLYRLCSSPHEMPAYAFVCIKNSCILWCWIHQWDCMVYFYFLLDFKSCGATSLWPYLQFRVIWFKSRLEMKIPENDLCLLKMWNIVSFRVKLANAVNPYPISSTFQPKTLRVKMSCNIHLIEVVSPKMSCNNLIHFNEIYLIFIKSYGVNIIKEQMLFYLTQMCLSSISSSCAYWHMEVHII